MKNFFLSFVILLSSFETKASPQKIEMIFLSPQKVSQLLELIKKNESEKWPSRLAVADQEGIWSSARLCQAASFVKEN
jgi:hypothetical protein